MFVRTRQGAAAAASPLCGRKMSCLVTVPYKCSSTCGQNSCAERTMRVAPFAYVCECVCLFRTRSFNKIFHAQTSSSVGVQWQWLSSMLLRCGCNNGNTEAGQPYSSIAICSIDLASNLCDNRIDSTHTHTHTMCGFCPPIRVYMRTYVHTIFMNPLNFWFLFVKV